MNPPKISLAAARVNRNLTQKTAATKLGISHDTLRNYEKGETTPDWDMVEKISQVYRYPKDYIKFTRNSA